EGRLDAAGTQAADRLRVGQSGCPGAAGGVDLDGDQDRHAAAVDELAADDVARALGRDHDDVDALRSLEVAEADVEAVDEDQGLASGEVVLDGLVEDLRLDLVRGGDRDDVGPLGDLGGGADGQALGLGLVAALRALLEADPNLDTGVAEAERVRVA